MIAHVGLTDLAMAGIIVGSVIFMIALIGYLMMRFENKVGPLARVQQQAEIERYRAEAILAAKDVEARQALADAKIIEAQAKADKARNAAYRELEP